jgi:hypothetical protein
VEQSARALDLSKDGIEGAAKRGTGVAEIVGQSTEKLIAAEKPYWTLLQSKMLW